jgi:hypothetical protein
VEEGGINEIDQSHKTDSSRLEDLEGMDLDEMLNLRE